MRAPVLTLGVAALLLVAAAVSPARADKIYPDGLAIHFLGVEEQENVRGLVREQLSAYDPYVELIRVNWQEPAIPSWEHFERERSARARWIVIEVSLSLPEWLRMKQRWGGDPFPGEGYYPARLYDMVQDSARGIARLVDEFKGSWPKSKTIAYGVSMGSETLVQTLPQLQNRFDRIYLISPPVSAVQPPDQSLAQFLENLGYRKNQVVISVEKQAPTFLPLHALTQQNPKPFRLYGINLQGSPQLRQRYWGSE